MAEILDLIPPVAALAPGAPEPMVAQAYVDAARLFFRKTLAWVGDVPIGSAVSTSEYQLDLPAGTEVVDGKFVQYKDDTKSLTKATRAIMIMRSSRSDARPHFYRVTSSKIFFGPDTGADVSADITKCLLALRPTYGATEIDDEIVSQFHDILLNGAAYNILAMPGKEWANTALAATKFALFQNDIDEWTARAVDEGMTGIVRVVQYGGL